MIKQSLPLNYFGGKRAMSEWIASVAAKTSYTHRNTPFAGGLGELLGTDAWPIDSISETVNDLDHELINFWCALRCPEQWPEFFRRINCIPLSDTPAPFSVDERDGISRAIGFFLSVRFARGGVAGSSYVTPSTRTRRGMNEQVSRWLSAVDNLPEIHERLRRVEVRNMDALTFIRIYDHPQALFYCDPPYMHDTRSAGGYANEMTDLQHRELCMLLATIQGKFILSGYDNDMYRNYVAANCWNVHRQSFAKPSSAGSRAMEYLWTNF